LPSIIKVDQIQSDTGSIVYPSNVSLGNTSVTNFGSTGVNARLHVEGIINLNDGQAFAFGGGTGRPSLSGNKSAGTLSFGVGGGSSKMILYGTGSDTTQGYLDLPVGQIKFPASQNASSDANTLDDYEEGTWSPRITDDTTSSAAGLGHYRKIGNLVIAQFQHYNTDISSIPAGNALYMSGLPYVQGSGGASHQVLATPSGTLYGTLLAHDRNGAASFVLYAPSSTDRVNWVTLTRTVWGASSVSVYGTYIYRAAN